jgi:hypothetical protein
MSVRVARALVRLSNILHVQGGSTYLRPRPYTYIASGQQSRPLAGQDVSSTPDYSLSPSTTLQTSSSPSIASAYRFPFGLSRFVTIIAILPSLPFIVVPISNKFFHNKYPNIAHQRLNNVLAISR